MMNRHIALGIIAVCIAWVVQPATPQQPSSPNLSPPRFDSTRDAAADIQAALLEASRTHRRVLLDVGGDWCAYCLQLDAFFHDNNALLAMRDRLYVIVRVYYDDRHKNEKPLAGFPPIQGIPHIYVLDEQGNVLHSQHVVELRESGVYSPAKMKAFLQQWSVSGSTQGQSSQTSAAASQ